MEDEDRSRVNDYNLSVTAIDTLALGGAQPVVIEEVRQRLEPPLIQPRSGRAPPISGSMAHVLGGRVG